MIDSVIRGLIDRGHEATLVCGKPVGSRSYSVVGAGETYSQYFFAPKAVRRLKPPVDLVVDVENGIPFFSPLWWRGARILFVQHVHTNQWKLRFPPPAAAAGRFLEGRVMPRLYRNDIVAVPSESTRQGLVALGFKASNIHVVSLGTDPLPTLPKSPEPLFLSLGRLVPHKRIDLLLDAWRRVRPVTGGRLVVAGDGPELARLTAKADATVEIRGAVSESERNHLLAESWLLVHSAMHEGWGMVVMEAAAAGTPTLAFDVAGVRDAVVQNRTGTLVTSEDEFVAEWIALAGDVRRRDAMGAAAHRRASTFGWSTTVDDFERIADLAIAKRGSGHD